MDDAEGFVVHGNKKAWVKYALRAFLITIVAADLASIVRSYHLAHLYQSIPFNMTVASVISETFLLWAILELVVSCLVGWMAAGRAPLISVNCDGVRIKTLGYRARRLSWDEIKSICPANLFPFPLFGWQKMNSLILVPHRSSSLCSHLTAWERLWAFGSTRANAPHCPGWIAVSGIVMEISPEEFIERLHDYYEKHAMLPELPGWPFPSQKVRVAERCATFYGPLSETKHANVVQSRNVCSPTRALSTGQTQRRALHRTRRPLYAGIRRRMPYNRGAERMSAMLKQDTETQTVPTVPSIPTETDQRVTPDELTAAIEAIERRKAETQKRMAETIPVDQAVRELGIDATPEEVLAEVRAQRAARDGGAPSASAAAPAPPLAANDKERFEAFLRQFVKESGLDALPDEVIARLRARRLARAQGTAVVPSMGANTGSSNKRARRGMGIGLAAFLFFGWSTGWWQHAPKFPTYNITPVDSKPITKMLTEIPENHPFTSDTASLQEIAEGKPANTITVIDNEEMDNNHYWTVVKKSGHYYIDAYLPGRVSPDALKIAPLTIYNAEEDTPGGDSVKVTVQIDGTRVVSSHDAGEDSTITLSNIHPDDISYDQ